VDLLSQLQSLQGAPSVQMQEVPPQFVIRHDIPGDDDDGGSADDVREKGPGIISKGNGERRVHESEFYDGDNDNKDIQ